jgi:hypothetical protein
MAKPIATLLIGFCLASGSSCGRKGPLVLPPGGEPMAVTGLAAVPSDGAVVLEWTNPAKAVSGRPVGRLAAVEVWVFDRGLPAAGRPPTADEVVKTARLVRRIAAREFAAFKGRDGAGPGAMTFPFVPDQAPAGPKRLAFTVRVLDAKDRVSDFALPVAAELAPDGAGAGRPAPKGVSYGGGTRP